MALKAIVSIYTYEENQTKKAELVVLVSETFPYIQLLVCKLMKNYNGSTETLILLILKIFGYATYKELFPGLKASDSLHIWLIFVKQLIDSQPGSDPTPNHLNIKKRCLKIILRFVQKHANRNYDPRFHSQF